MFIPLGDDFRWDSADEANKQFSNYKQLFDHVCTVLCAMLCDFDRRSTKTLLSTTPRPSSAHWQTTSMLCLKRRRSTLIGMLPLRAHIRTYMLMRCSIPSLSGDFFTYADRDDHYWSGALVVHGPSYID